MNAKRAAFHFFTYTIHAMPNPRLLLSDEARRFGLNPSAPATALKKKNEIFESCIWDSTSFFHPKRKASGTVILKANQIKKDGFFLVKIGCEKKANLPDINLVDHEHPYFPYVYIWTKPEPIVSLPVSPIYESFNQREHGRLNFKFFGVNLRLQSPAESTKPSNQNSKNVARNVPQSVIWNLKSAGW